MVELDVITSPIDNGIIIRSKNAILAFKAGSFIGAVRDENKRWDQKLEAYSDQVDSWDIRVYYREPNDRDRYRESVTLNFPNPGERDAFFAAITDHAQGLA